MRSLSLLPDLRKLPAKRLGERMSFTELITDLVISDHHSKEAGFDTLTAVQSEVKRLTNIEAHCRVIEDVDEAVSVLSDHTREADRATKLKLRGARMLPHAISNVPMIAGQALSAAVDSVLPGVGTAIGIPGSVLFDKAGKHLDDRSKPLRLKLELTITGLNLEDLFYLKNKRLIDDLALRFRESARGLTDST